MVNFFNSSDEWDVSDIDDGDYRQNEYIDSAPEPKSKGRDTKKRDK